MSVSTRSRPKAAGFHIDGVLYDGSVSTRSRPKAAGLCVTIISFLGVPFQHAAARRRLVQGNDDPAA